jgi:hypothetical protein
VNCGECGAPANPGEQCAACGAFVIDDGGGSLELESVPAGRVYDAGADSATASDAQIGGSGGRVPVAAPPRVIPERTEESPSFADSERAVRTDAWRLTRIPVLIILAYFTISHLILTSNWIFLDNVNVLFHEAGHVFFGWDGMMLAALGGTLGQLLMPAIFGVYFWFWQKQRFAAVTCAWWFGENFVNIGRYMKDAVVQELPLIGGDVHDWGYIFKEWGLLGKARSIGSAFHWIGIFAMLGTLALLVYWTVRPTEEEIDGRRELEL